MILFFFLTLCNNLPFITPLSWYAFFLWPFAQTCQIYYSGFLRSSCCQCILWISNLLSLLYIVQVKLFLPGCYSFFVVPILYRISYLSFFFAHCILRFVGRIKSCLPQSFYYLWQICRAFTQRKQYMKMQHIFVNMLFSKSLEAYAII